MTERRAEHAPAAAGARLDDRLFVLCGLAWAAGLIHVVAAIDHVGEELLYAAFFAFLAPAQLAWGTLLYRRPTARLLQAGAVVSLGVAAIWLVSRTSGLPAGPEPWQPEAVGPLDAIATADEVALALVALAELRGPVTGRAVRVLGRVGTAAGVGLILLSSLAIALAGHAH